MPAAHPYAPSRAPSLDWIDPCLAALPPLWRDACAPPAARQIARGLAELFSLALLALAATLCVAVDLQLHARGIPEDSLTEFVQAGLLLASALAFARAALRRPAARGFHVLAAGFFATLLVRELDGFFDLVRHGFWVWPAALAALASLAYAALHGDGTVAKPLADFLQSPSGQLVGLGLVVVLVFSRAFGSGTLWTPVLGPDATALKNVLQEGMELFGYALVAAGLHRHFPAPP